MHDMKLKDYMPFIIFMLVTWVSVGFLYYNYFYVHQPVVAIEVCTVSAKNKGSYWNGKSHQSTYDLETDCGTMDINSEQFKEVEEGSPYTFTVKGFISKDQVDNITIKNMEEVKVKQIDSA